MDAASIDDALTDDHVQLDGLFRAVRTAIGLRSPGAESAQAAFEQRLFRHMTWEEQSLFPALVHARPNYPARKIESLQIDHERIREKLRELAAAVTARDWPQGAACVEDLWVLLEGHNRDEEKGVYTDADHLLSKELRVAMLENWKRGG
jgi:hemerythrin-like domain-containing protein